MEEVAALATVSDTDGWHGGAGMQGRPEKAQIPGAPAWGLAGGAGGWLVLGRGY